MAIREKRLPKYLQIYSLKIQAFERVNYTCEYCGSTDDLCIDHIDGNRKNNTLNNFAVSCRRCNLKKGNKTLSKLGWCNPRYYDVIPMFWLLDQVKTSCQQVMAAKWTLENDSCPIVQKRKQRFIQKLNLFKKRLGDKTLGDFNVYTQYHVTEDSGFRWHDKLKYPEIEQQLLKDIDNYRGGRE